MPDPNGILFLGRTNWPDRIRPIGMHPGERRVRASSQARKACTFLLMEPEVAPS